MKRKTLTLAISVFALLAIISVGFASWVITRPTGSKEAEGSIEVDDVTDLSATITYEWVDSADLNTAKKIDETKPVIIFGNKEGALSTDWLYNTSGKTQNLNAYLKVTVTVSNADVLKGKKIVAKFNAVAGTNDGDATLEQFTSAMSDGYIKGYNNGYLNESLFTETDFATATTVSKIIPLEFNWGEAKFGGVHPADHFSVEQADTAKTALQELYKRVKGITFKVTLAQE